MRVLAGPVRRNSDGLESSPVQILPHGIEFVRLGHDGGACRVQCWMRLGCAVGTGAQT